VKAKGIFYVFALVSDLDRSKAFYRDTIGWQLGTDENRVAGFSFGSGYLVLHADGRGGSHRHYAGGLQVDVQVEDAAAEHSRLAKLGVNVGPLTNQPWGERNFTFTDPDGYVWFVGQQMSGGPT
jgi:catechol 2,3-dioxygenase-like lactoylglutathione lyase family enzyme